MNRVIRLVVLCHSDDLSDHPTFATKRPFLTSHTLSLLVMFFQPLLKINSILPATNLEAVTYRIFVSSATPQMNHSTMTRTAYNIISLCLVCQLVSGQKMRQRPRFDNVSRYCLFVGWLVGVSICVNGSLSHIHI
jgi:hypothetical protein